jgi:flavin reductase (DIM6/NTAB) family NADH-FMN oxidoreductase RutF
MSIHDVAYPRQVILVTSRAEVNTKFSPEKQTKDNIMALSWHSPVSFSPELYAVMIGKQRYSYKLIKESKIFVVNFMDIKHEQAVLYCGRNSGEHIDKFQETVLEKEEAEKVDCCRIKQALGCLECRVIQEVEAGDHVILIGEIVHSSENKKGKKIFQVEGDIFTTTK